MKHAIFFIGLPGAGKSTIIKEKYKDWKIISADDWKESHPDYHPLTAHKIHQESVKWAEEEVYKSIEQNIDFVFDSGGINDNYALRIIKAVYDKKYYMKLHVINTPIHICFDRINNRERKVPFDDIADKAVKMNWCIEKQSPFFRDIIFHNYYTNKHIFFDMDGVLVEHQQYALPKINNTTVKPDFVNSHFFELAKPVQSVVDKCEFYSKNSSIYILSVSPNSLCNQEKLSWLKKHCPWIKEENIFFVGDKRHKITTLIQLMNKLKLSKQDVTYIDDVHELIHEAENNFINAIHPSRFLTSRY